MSRKRSLIPDLHKAHPKRRCAAASGSQVNGESSSADTNGVGDATHNETRTALLFLRGLVPVEKFERPLPPIILKHQLYSIVGNRTQADKQLSELQNGREVKVFKLGPDETSRSVVFTEDYRDHVIEALTLMKVERPLIEKVKKYLLLQHTDISVDVDTLVKSYNFTDTDVSQLVKASVLIVRDVGSYWLSMPNAGQFTYTFNRGRKAIKTMIKKSKCKEILREELEQKQWPRVARLGISYHIHDIIGADIVTCINTNSGQLLRLRE